MGYMPEIPIIPTVFVAFGITGDLMRQKILPALFTLHQKNELPDNFEIIGISRKAWSNVDLREYVASVVGKKNKERSQEKLGLELESFLARFSFIQGDTGEESLFAKLAEKIGARSAILYFSLSPALYKIAFEKLADSPLALRQDRGDLGKIRLMIEKPFGSDAASAETLNAILYQKFSESEIYRIDHYLAKESLEHLARAEKKEIASITVSFLETAGVEKRGVSYDAVGMLRDVGQNHMLELFATAVGATGGSRAEVIKQLHILTSEEVAVQTTHTQYEGYQDIVGVAPGSKTETYFKVETFWHDGQREVPVVFEAGKRQTLDKKSVSIIYADGAAEEFPIEGNAGKSEHERLIFDCLHGNHTLFVGQEEIAALWRFIDPIIKVWYQ